MKNRVLVKLVLLISLSSKGARSEDAVGARADARKRLLRKSKASKSKKSKSSKMSKTKGRKPRRKEGWKSKGGSKKNGDKPNFGRTCTTHEATVLARGHQDHNSMDPDGGITQVGYDNRPFQISQVKSTDELFNGYHTLGYTQCNGAAYLKFPTSPDIFGGNVEGDEWAVTCTTVLLNQNKDDGSVSQITATGFPGGGLFEETFGGDGPFKELDVPIVGGTGEFEGIVGSISLNIAKERHSEGGLGTTNDMIVKARVCK